MVESYLAWNEIHLHLSPLKMVLECDLLKTSKVIQVHVATH